MKGFDSQWYLRRTGIQLAAPKKRKKRGPSKLEEKFMRLWEKECHNNPFPFEKEYRFDPRRRYRFDFAWPKYRVALECDGGLFLKRGGHTSGTGKRRDAHKDWLATQSDWTVIRWTNDMITEENCRILSCLLFSLTIKPKPIRFMSVAD